LQNITRQSIKQSSGDKAPPQTEASLLGLDLFIVALAVFFAPWPTALAFFAWPSYPWLQKDRGVRDHFGNKQDYKLHSK
jgi:hypothetical protein